MNLLYKKLLILGLSGIARWKNEKEMIIPDGILNDWYGPNLTCEFLGDGRYMLRGYYDDGSIRFFGREYKDGVLIRRHNEL